MRIHRILEVATFCCLFILSSFTNEKSSSLTVLLPEFGQYEVNWKGEELQFTGNRIIYENPEEGFGFLRIVGQDGKTEVFKGLLFIQDGKSQIVDLRSR